MVSSPNLNRCFVVAFLVSSVTRLYAEPERVDFSSQIRPLLNKHCTSCHGGVKQASDLSFIYEQQVLDSGIIEPGNPQESELLHRITTTDPDLRMPPVEEHPEPLSRREVELITLWIEQGAEWDGHWAFRKPAPPDVPDVNDTLWSNTALDRFVLAKLENEGLRPTDESEPTEWLRRVSFDLIGLPPTEQELLSFLDACESNSDNRLATYQAEVDRLLVSPHFGERWASMWLDLARYADSQGYEKDNHRHAWPFRDWVIAAFNADMPFDEFTLKQLAGDLLPEPTADDLIATLFHRNTQTNDEGGTDDEEFRVAAVIDRINTTWTVWMGTTFGCVQCHSHPYDPFRHEEFYQFMAMLNNTADHDLSNDYPTLTYPENKDKQELESTVALTREHKALREQLNREGVALAEGCADWTKLFPTEVSSSHGELEITDDHLVRVVGGTIPANSRYFVKTTATELRALRVEILPESDDPAKWPERGSVLSQIKLTLELADGTSQPVEIHDVIADYLAGPFDPKDSLQENHQGFGGYPKLHGPRWAVFVLKQPLAPPAGAVLSLELHQKASTSGGQSIHLRRFGLTSSADPAWSSLVAAEDRGVRQEELQSLAASLQQLKGTPIPIMQTRSRDYSRPTRTFIRGNWQTRGDLVVAGVPETLHELDLANPGRTELAEWLVADDNPLTARVLVNRIWSELFGIGLVETLEDFGSTGTPPSHPALLDHLAVQLQQEHTWHIKPFLRDLVLSSTYRQANRITPELLERDPRNRLLARGPRTRLTAEMVRDQALVTAGKLSPKIGGPSVMPPQPEGVWQAVYSGAKWKAATDADRYRRALYTYWRRTSPYPSFMTFDSPSREVCSPRRIATNTPLQALVTLNDPVYVELSEHLAVRVMDRADSLPEDWIREAYLIVTQNQLTNTTVTELVALFEATRSEYEKAVDSEAETDHDRAAMTVVASAILNLDEALVK